MAVPTFDPPSDTIVAPFWEGIDEGQLRLPRCSVCGAWEWYPNPAGPACEGAELEWVELPGTGTVFSYTVVRRPFAPATTAADVPTAIVLVELDGAAGTRLLGNRIDGTPVIGGRVATQIVEHGGRRRPVFVATNKGDDHG